MAEKLADQLAFARAVLQEDGRGGMLGERSPSVAMRTIASAKGASIRGGPHAQVTTKNAVEADRSIDNCSSSGQKYGDGGCEP